MNSSQASLLAKFANFGLAQSTWSCYKTVLNHLDRCENETGTDLSLPFNLHKTLTFVAWLMDERKVKASTIEKYLSGLRMIHLTEGTEIPCLREPMVKLILTGRKNWDNLKERTENKSKRDPVTAEMMKFFKAKLLTMNWSIEKKLMFYSVITLAWNGSFRIHELLSKESNTFDPTTTLLWKDISLHEVTFEGKKVEVLSVFLKSPKVDRIGAGQKVEVFETKSFMCAIKSFKKYEASISRVCAPDEPVFREKSGECFTGAKLNKCLDEISYELKCKGINVKNHSFRSGVPTMMAALGYSEDDIMAAGRWKSKAFMAYTKLPRLQRAKFAAELTKRMIV